MHTGFKQVAPEQDPGMRLDDAYEMGQSLYDARRGKEGFKGRAFLKGCSQRAVHATFDLKDAPLLVFGNLKCHLLNTNSR